MRAPSGRELAPIRLLPKTWLEILLVDEEGVGVGRAWVEVSSSVGGEGG